MRSCSRSHADSVRRLELLVSPLRACSSRSPPPPPTHSRSPQQLPTHPRRAPIPRRPTAPARCPTLPTLRSAYHTAAETAHTAHHTPAASLPLDRSLAAVLKSRVHPSDALFDLCTPPSRFRCDPRFAAPDSHRPRAATCSPQPSHLNDPHSLLHLTFAKLLLHCVIATLLLPPQLPLLPPVALTFFPPLPLLPTFSSHSPPPTHSPSPPTTISPPSWSPSCST